MSSYPHTAARASARASARGFTLAETLIALGISSLVATALVSVLAVTLSMRTAVTSRITERVTTTRIRSTFDEALNGVSRITCDGTSITLAVPEEEMILLRGREIQWKKRRPYGIPRTVIIASNVSAFSSRIERGDRGAEALIISLQTDGIVVEYIARYARKN